MNTGTKPIKRSKELVHLSRDHHAGLLLCWKIRTGFRNGTATERIKDYVLYFFEHDLKEHFRQEEELLFVLMEDKDPMKVEALAQHDILYGLINTLKANVEEEAEVLKKFADQLDEHIRYEERQLFPYIEKNISNEKLKDVEEQLNQLHETRTELPWSDEFWMKKK